MSTTKNQQVTEKGSPKFSVIAQSARNLTVPSAALFFECHQSISGQLDSELAELNVAIEAVREKGFAAATTLQLLNHSAAITDKSFTEIFAEAAKGGSV